LGPCPTGWMSWPWDGRSLRLTRSRLRNSWFVSTWENGHTRSVLTRDLIRTANDGADRILPGADELRRLLVGGFSSSTSSMNVLRITIVGAMATAEGRRKAKKKAERGLRRGRLTRRHLALCKCPYSNRSNYPHTYQAGTSSSFIEHGTNMLRSSYNVSWANHHLCLFMTTVITM
jgi:hypothetical protein